MTWFSPGTPVGYAELLMRRKMDRARDSWTEGERGASAVEWVVISAIVVAIALAIGVILTRALTNKANDVETKIGTSGNGGTGGGGGTTP
jgi:Flp pilus assembly pilin Flp